MKRNPDLIRALVHLVEEADSSFDTKTVALDGFTEDEVSLHWKLLIEAELVDAVCVSSLNSSDFVTIKGLTNLGHDFADSIRDESKWNKVTDFIESNGVPFTIAMLQEVIQRLFP